MYFYTSKILQELLWPLNWALAGLILSLWFLRREDTFRARFFCVLALASLLIPSLPWVEKRIKYSLERTFPSRPVEDYPSAGAIVVLGGSVAPSIAPRFEPEELGGSRLLPAVRLYRLGKAPWIVVSSGARYTDLQGKERVDAEEMSIILRDMGVPDSAILTEQKSRTTRENAERTAELLLPRGISKILLVTHGWHLRRAVKWFEGVGFSVTGVSAAREVALTGLAPRDLFPTATSLAGTTSAIKEWIGYLAP